jgi:hypothetical protein
LVPWVREAEEGVGRGLKAVVGVLFVFGWAVGD